MVTHMAAGAMGLGFNFPVARAHLNLILGPFHRQVSSVGYTLNGCNKLIVYAI